MLLALLLSASLPACDPCKCGLGGGLPPPPECLTRPAPAASTQTGIPLDTEWKSKVFDFAKKNVTHPSWGIAHSERDYQVALTIAQQEGVALDLDVLFAAAFLHDLGGIGAFAKAGVDHAARSVELVEPVLREWGFPMEKWPKVQDMILGHSYYGPAPTSDQSLAFRDADIVDFLGSIGIARILAVTQEPGREHSTLGPTVNLLRGFLNELPAKAHFESARKMANTRASELRRFLQSLDSMTWGGAAL